MKRIHAPKPDATPGATRRALIRTRGTDAPGILLAKLLPFLILLVSGAAALGQSPQANDAATPIRLKSEVLGEERTILVRTPPGYERGGERFPVLYMTDGDAHILHTSASIAFLARNGRMPEMIVVGITNTDRTRDLTPTKALGDGLPIQVRTSGGADKFLKFIETELIPAVESRYRTQPFRVFAGHSLGGLFAVHAMLSRPDLFNAFIAVSPSLQWDSQVVVKRGEEFFKTHKEWKKSLYFTLGDERGDILDGFKQFREVLTKNQPKSFEWEALQLLDEDHGSVVLPSHYWALRKIFDGWQMARDSSTGRVAGGLRGVDEHYKKVSQKFGYTVAAPEALVNQIGYQHLFAGEMDEAINVFKANVERHPASANVYDSLGEAYERSGNFDLARQNYEKASTLGKDGDPNLPIYKANLDRATEKAREAASGKK
ncbi:MAG TPA: alpha/beta hydrolase-fold protein [Pyrinomonadaceae bacterium]|jgi:predicted alpha/beta superfamily hydrolase|nr:alpha/beta hydrolase-fold protein [Pyrinomonadaceae bacterium]